jgi:hypothetical protein
MPFLAILNGFIRDFTYLRVVGEWDAHQISSITLILILLVYGLFIRQSLAITSVQQAVTCGLVWALLTFTFESILELWVLHESLQQMLSHYRHGEWWPLVLIFVGTLPLMLFLRSVHVRNAHKGHAG